MEFTLKKDSWHYWIANYGEKRVRPEWDEGNDICSYTRAFLKGLMWLVVSVGFVAAFTVWVCASLWNLGEFFFYGAKLEIWTNFFLAMLTIFGLLMASLAIKIKYEQYRDSRPVVEKPPGFVKLAYRKFKDKTCFRLNFE